MTMVVYPKLGYYLITSLLLIFSTIASYLQTSAQVMGGTMDIHCNASIANTIQVGELPGYGTVWYHPKGIVNILSVSRVK
jgi:hypothetical protein